MLTALMNMENRNDDELNVCSDCTLSLYIHLSQNADRTAKIINEISVGWVMKHFLKRYSVSIGVQSLGRQQCTGGESVVNQ